MSVMFPINHPFFSVTYTILKSYSAFRNIIYYLAYMEKSTYENTFVKRTPCQYTSLRYDQLIGNFNNGSFTKRQHYIAHNVICIYIYIYIYIYICLNSFIQT